MGVSAPPASSDEMSVQATMAPSAATTPPMSSPRPSESTKSARELVSPTNVPSTATPSVPPTIRFIVRIPDATPALLRSTAFIAAVVIGDMTSAMPMPISTKPGSRKPKPEVGVSNDCHASATATRARPAVMSGRSPMRSVWRPAIGAMTITINVVGRKRTPASSAE